MNHKSNLFALAALPLMAIGGVSSPAQAQSLDPCLVEVEFEGAVTSQAGNQPACNLVFGTAEGIVSGGVPSALTVNLFVGDFATADALDDQGDVITTCQAADAIPDGVPDRADLDCSDAVDKRLRVFVDD